MDWTERFNEVIDYIEEHLTEDIDYGALARIALCSTYHFQRMFAYIAGVPLSEYIRRRRMSLAAVDLQSGERVIDVGLKSAIRRRRRSTGRFKAYTASPRPRSGTRGRA